MLLKLFSWKNLGLCFEFLAGTTGLVFLVYGFYVLLVERANIPVCSLEVLNNQNEALLAQQPKLTVEVTGAVNKPGVWQFSRTDRVGRAIEVAGGFSPEVDTEYVAKQLNLAELLTDGQKLYIPFRWEKQAANEVESNQQNLKLISINQATKEELQTLTGIGESRATAIIENRPYTELIELVDKEVLSTGIFDQIKSLISL